VNGGRRPVDLVHRGDVIGPFSSTGLPMTFMMRPSTDSPTGTLMPPPVSVTFMPRTRPSLTSIAIGADRLLAEVLRDLEDRGSPARR
jgi:hypothetical protein